MLKPRRKLSLRQRMKPICSQWLKAWSSLKPNLKQRERQRINSRARKNRSIMVTDLSMLVSFKTSINRSTKKLPILASMLCKTKICLKCNHNRCIRKDFLNSSKWDLKDYHRFKCHHFSSRKIKYCRGKTWEINSDPKFKCKRDNHNISPCHKTSCSKINNRCHNRHGSSHCNSNLSTDTIRWWIQLPHKLHQRLHNRFKLHHRLHQHKLSRHQHKLIRHQHHNKLQHHNRLRHHKFRHHHNYNINSQPIKLLHRLKWLGRLHHHHL